MKKIMKRAHQLAKKMVGHYSARLALGLRIAWREAKGIIGNETGSVNLAGSKKQIKWAESIREDFEKEIERQLKRMNRHLETTPYEDAKEEIKEEIELWKKFKERIENEESASWFIDNRNVAPYKLAGLPEID